MLIIELGNIRRRREIGLDRHSVPVNPQRHRHILIE